jgi:cytochrome c oxidase subunit IV
MSESHGPEAHHGPTIGVYLAVGVALAVLTALSFVFNYLAHEERQVISKFASFALILTVAVCKAVLVGMVFMHLRWDWFKLYFMIVPAFILGTMMMVVLLPDFVLAWHQ